MTPTRDLSLTPFLGLGPLAFSSWASQIVPEQAGKVPLALATLETLGQQVGELELSRSLVQSHVTILDSLIMPSCQAHEQSASGRRCAWHAFARL